VLRGAPGKFVLAIWLVPAAILFFEHSRLAAATLLLIALTLWLQHLRWPILSSIALAIVAESAVVLAMDAENLIAIVTAGCAALLLWRQASLLRRAAQTDVLLATLAALLILAGLVRLMEVRHFGDNAQANSGDADKGAQPAPEAGDGTAIGGDFTGVILIPKPEKTVTLVPPLPAMSSNVFNDSHRDPLTIPFFGVYWFYRFPNPRPPLNSVTLRGTPEEFRFHSTGRVELKMEAQQNLGSMIDMSCCSSIQVAIHNLDLHAQPIQVELILANSREPGSPSHTLGAIPIQTAELQMLTFPMTPGASFRQFDQITVRVHRAWFQHTESARISVQRFVLIPAGR
jgi:branched-subunit amino acid ABC-type transport system permease component